MRKKLPINKILIFVVTIVFTIVVVLRFSTIRDLNTDDKNFFLYNIEGKELFSIKNQDGKTKVHIYDKKRVSLRGFYKQDGTDYRVFPYSFIDINSSDVNRKGLQGSLVYQFISDSNSKKFTYPVRFRKFEIIGGSHFGKYLPIARLKDDDKPLLIIFPAKDKKFFGRENSVIRAISLQEGLIYIDNKGNKKELPYVNSSINRILNAIKDGELEPIVIEKQGVITRKDKKFVLNLFLSNGLISKKVKGGYVQRSTKYFNLVEYSNFENISSLTLSDASKVFYFKENNTTYLKAPKNIPIDREIIVKGRDTLFNYSKYLSRADFSIKVPILDKPKIKIKKEKRSYLYDYLDIGNMYGLYVSDKNAKVYYSKDGKRWISAVENYKYSPPLYLFNPDIEGRFIAPSAFKKHKGKLFYKVVATKANYTISFNGEVKIDAAAPIDSNYKKLIPINKKEIIIEAKKKPIPKCGKLFSLDERKAFRYAYANSKNYKELQVNKEGGGYGYYINEYLNPFKEYTIVVEGYKTFSYKPQLSCKYSKKSSTEKIVSLYNKDNYISIIPKRYYTNNKKVKVEIEANSTEANSSVEKKYTIPKELIPVYGDGEKFGLLATGVKAEELTIDKPFSMQISKIFQKRIKKLLNNKSLLERLKKLNEKIEGATVVIKITKDGNREIVGAFSYPYPNSSRVGRELIVDILNSSASTIQNRAFSMWVHPGSTFKMVTSIALAKEGKLQELSMLNGKTDLFGVPFADSKIDFHLKNYTDPGKGTEVTREANYKNAFKHSYNTYFGYSGLLLHKRLSKHYSKYLFPILLNEQKRKGEYTLTQVAEDLYFNQKIPLSNRYNVYASASRFPTIFTSAKEVADSAIGQYEVYATPLQMAIVASTLYDNRLILPTIVKGEKRAIKLDNISEQKDANIIKRLFFKESDLKEIQEAMNLVVKKGTASPAFRGFDFKKCEVYGKTGTAQKGKPGLYDGWFVSFTKGLKEDIVVATVIKNSGVGANYAAPINRKIIEAWVERVNK
jgi:cell division protein FtsI/penicillin-binding protein 2